MKLTRTEKRRIRLYMRALEEHLDTPRHVTLRRYEDLSNPDEEIRIWEAIARAYTAELRVRSRTTRQERRLIYRALLLATRLGPRVDLILKLLPNASRIQHLNRVLRQLQPIGHHQRQIS